jgi:hypothetical protein
MMHDAALLRWWRGELERQSTAKYRYFGDKGRIPRDNSNSTDT